MSFFCELGSRCSAGATRVRPIIEAGRASVASPRAQDAVADFDETAKVIDIDISVLNEDAAAGKDCKKIFSFGSVPHQAVS